MTGFKLHQVIIYCVEYRQFIQSRCHSVPSQISQAQGATQKAKRQLRSRIIGITLNFQTFTQIISSIITVTWNGKMSANQNDEFQHLMKQFVLNEVEVTIKVVTANFCQVRLRLIVLDSYISIFTQIFWAVVTVALQKQIHN